MSKDSIVIVSAVRTPLGGMLGALMPFTAPQLGAEAIKGALSHAHLSGDDVDEVIMGNVLSAGLRQAPARQAALGAKLPLTTRCLTINKVCGSAMKAIMLGADSLRLGHATVVVAGGMESMSHAPFMLMKGREGYRYGHSQLMDHMAMDGLEDAYDQRSMGTFAEDTADKYGFSREEQDAFAINSVKKAKKAMEKGHFTNEIIPLSVKGRKGEEIIAEDEQIEKANIEKIPLLRPAFRDNGTVTAANSSSISDGASAVVLMRESEAEKRGCTPLARIVDYCNFAQEPCWFTTTPTGAMKMLHERTGWTVDTTDLYEINEAFALVPMTAERDLSIPHDKINIHGGACILGHPIGASGARIVTTLVHALHSHQLKRGIASICLGGGEATALAVERI